VRRPLRGAAKSRVGRRQEHRRKGDSFGTIKIDIAETLRRFAEVQAKIQVGCGTKGLRHIVRAVSSIRPIVMDWSFAAPLKGHDLPAPVEIMLAAAMRLLVGALALFETLPFILAASTSHTPSALRVGRYLRGSLLGQGGSPRARWMAP
jgi:hypothetical protein